MNRSVRVDWALTLATAVALGAWPSAAAAQAPSNATAQCGDGTYSTSKNASGVCSGHGGVAQWLAAARCGDGSLSLSKKFDGTCDGTTALTNGTRLLSAEMGRYPTRNHAVGRVRGT